MKALQAIQDGYALGFIANNEYVDKVMDHLYEVGLMFHDTDLLMKFDAVQAAAGELRKRYPDEGVELEAVLNGLYALLAADVENLVVKLLK